MFHNLIHIRVRSDRKRIKKYNSEPCHHPTPPQKKVTYESINKKIGLGGTPVYYFFCNISFHLFINPPPLVTCSITMEEAEIEYSDKYQDNVYEYR